MKHVFQFVSRRRNAHDYEYIKFLINSFNKLIKFLNLKLFKIDFKFSLNYFKVK